MTLETKIQTEAMNFLDHDKKAGYAEFENYVYLTLAYYAVRIPKNRFYLNTESLIKRSADMFIMYNLDNAEELTVSEEMRKKGKNNIVLLKCKKFTTGINEKYLKLLTKKCCKLYAKSEKSAVYFVLNDEIYAACMPVTLKKEEKKTC